MENTHSIFLYSDYRRFLKERLAEIKRRSSHFSHRFVMMRLGIQSSGWLSNILSGKKNLTSKYVQALAELIGLSSREREYFELLVQYNQSESLEERESHYAKLARFQEIPAELIDRDRFDYFSCWYHSAIRELILLDGWNGRVKSIAERLVPNVSDEKISKSLDLLKSMGLLKKMAGGRWCVGREHIRKQKSDFGKIHYHQFVRNAMDLGRKASERFPVDERDISALVTPLDKESFGAIREEIRMLRRKIITLSERSVQKNSSDSEVYQFLFQVFPLTKVSDGGSVS